MKIRFFISFILFGVLFFGCNTSDPRKTRALQILKEIDGIAGKSLEEQSSAGIMQIIQRVNENKKDFPATRSELKKDAILVQNWFANKIDENRRVSYKYEELLGLGLAEREAECVRGVLKINRLQDEQSAIVISQYDLFADEKIVDKEMLESQNARLGIRSNEISADLVELEKIKKSGCKEEVK